MHIYGVVLSLTYGRGSWESDQTVCFKVSINFLYQGGVWKGESGRGSLEGGVWKGESGRGSLEGGVWKGRYPNQKLGVLVKISYKIQSQFSQMKKNGFFIIHFFRKSLF